MNATPDRSYPPSPAALPPAVRSTVVRGAWWVLGAPAFALAATPVLVVTGAPGDWIGAVWLAAVLWTIAVSLVQSLWAGFRHGDWSAFSCCTCPRDDDDFDYFSRTGTYAHLRIRAHHEALMREGDRCPQDRDHSGSLR